RSQGIPIYEPIGKVGEVGETTLAELDKFHKALEWYRKQRWNEAAEGMKTLRFANPESKLYKLYLKRIAEYRANSPGADWNGVWVWTSKSSRGLSLSAFRSRARRSRSPPACGGSACRCASRSTTS